MTPPTLVRTERGNRRRTTVVAAGLWSVALAGIAAVWTASGPGYPSGRR